MEFRETKYGFVYLTDTGEVRFTTNDYRKPLLCSVKDCDFLAVELFQSATETDANGRTVSYIELACCDRPECKNYLRSCIQEVTDVIKATREKVQRDIEGIENDDI